MGAQPGGHIVTPRATSPDVDRCRYDPQGDRCGSEVKSFDGGDVSQKICRKLGAGSTAELVQIAVVSVISRSRASGASGG